MDPPVFDLETLFGNTQIATPSKIDAMNPTDVNLIRALVSNTDLVDRFAHQIALYAKLDRKPEDTLRRFSLNGDNRLDFKEFHPALKRLFGHEITHAQSKELFTAFCPSSGKKLDIDQFCQIMGHWCLVAQRMRDQKYVPLTPNDPAAAQLAVDNNANIRRGLELATKHYDKLNEIFLKMDVGCTGYLTKEEFELAMNHLGVYLNGSEYDRLYAQLPDKIMTDQGVHYASFLTMLGVKLTTLFQNQKLWEKLLAHGDLLRKYLTHYQKQGKASMPPDHFRDLLGHCGITLSNADFTGLRLRMQEFQDVDGNINLADFLAAFNDKAAFLAKSTSLVGCTGPPSPPRRGKKKVDAAVAHDVTTSALVAPAGKSTEQRNAEAQTSRVKISQVKKPTFADLYMQNTKPQDDGAALPAITLEQRILSKIEQFKAMGYTHCASLRGLFPGDRFGKLTRGQIRQAVAQLSLVARHAEVETLFWKLDPAGRGYVAVSDFYRYMHSHGQVPVAKAEPREAEQDKDRPWRVDEKKFFEVLHAKIPEVVRACRSLDSAATGCVSKADFIWVMQEVGLIVSHTDAANAISMLSARKDGVVAYHTISETLEKLLHSHESSRDLPHLSNTSVLLDQTAVVAEEPAKPKPQHEYPAQRSSLQLGYGYDEPAVQEHERDLTSALQSNATLHYPLSETEKLERVLRQRHARRVLLIQNILERRTDLKICFDLMPYRESSNGLVLLTLDEIADILGSARMNLPLRSPDEAKTFLREIVPPNLDRLSKYSLRIEPSIENALVGFVELIRILTMAQRMEPEPDEDASILRAQCDVVSPAACDVSIRAKLLQYSTLKDVSVMQWNTTGAIIVRHAFKGLSRDMTAAAATGSFDAVCRIADLKHICLRLALDLTPSELAFVAAKVDQGKQGVFTSTALFQCFTQILYAL
ncbi:unnamed protein product [Aphanomyces euteiches]|nr:hypothetical protein AeRB84_002958 [Aphanomyces euteiches]